jgi:uncharacterized protein (DUF1330 family)
VSVYAIAQLRFKEVFRRHRGTLLAVDESPQVVGGRWDRDKVVLMSLPDRAAFRFWSESADYQEISKDRRMGADTLVLLAKGPA